MDGNPLSDEQIGQNFLFPHHSVDRGNTGQVECQCPNLYQSSFFQHFLLLLCLLMNKVSIWIHSTVCNLGGLLDNDAEVSLSSTCSSVTELLLSLASCCIFVMQSLLTMFFGKMCCDQNYL